MQIQAIQSSPFRTRPIELTQSGSTSNTGLQFGEATNLTKASSENGSWLGSIVNSVTGFVQKYGQYAIMGGFFSAVGLAGFTFFDNYADWIKDGNFPLENWPNTSDAILEQHHHSTGGEHTAHAPSGEAPHVHGPDCNHPAPASKTVGNLFADPEAPTHQDRIQNDRIESLQKQIDKLK